MAEVEGRKRPADESSLNDDQRFTKRFNLLSIGTSLGTPRCKDAVLRGIADNDARNGNGNSNLYIPVNNPAAAQSAVNSARDAQQTASTDELMQVDDTRDRVYIHDLDAELEGTEEEDAKLIFLPDIEQRLSKIPKQILLDPREREHQELVLYGTPKSLTVEEDRDAVRKAIIEARQRAHDKAVEEARMEDMMRRYEQVGGSNGAIETAHGYSAGYEEGEVDPDAMDIG